MNWIPLNTMYKKISGTLLCLALVCCFQAGRAQDSDEYPEQENEIVAPPIEDYEQEEYSKYEDVYVPDTAVYRQVPGYITDSLKRDEDFAYANDPEYWTKKKEARKERSERKSFWESFYDFFSSNTVRTIAYILIGLFILFLIFRVIIQNNLYMFYFSKKLAKTDNTEEPETDPETLDEKLKKALAENNYRMAVRYYYLKTLHILNERGMIRLHSQATNYQYLHQMSGNRLANEFRFLTDIYDYVWYGEFVLTENQFEVVNNNFRNFFQAVKF